MWTPDDDEVAAGHSVDPAGWRVLFDELMFLVAGRFARVEPRRTARGFVLGLLSPAERKNCWHLAEHAGHGDPQAMQRLRVSAGAGSKGPRWYDWAWVSAHQPGHTLLIRCGSTGELAFYRCWSPAPVTLATLVRIAGTRWSVEEQFQAAKSQVGLDHYQVGRRRSPCSCSAPRRLPARYPR